ncbi:DNA polymerase III subunit chi [Roseobacter sp. S98]|uniref:DNA polymerase III subunit chi n=1 Tax=Roseobacter algicola (ex Choi et al. 2025) (nom. illeg.) TaxID=3092138 RepID=UPI0035C73E62
MGTAMFYHLTRHPLEQTLAMLLDKAGQAGWRVLVRGTEFSRMDWLDQQLWLTPADGFLPHGLAGGAHDAQQPVLLSAGTEPAANGADCVMIVDGAPVTPDEVNALARVCVLFDGNDPAAVDTARGQWKALKDAGVTAQYWSEESGRWEKKAET